MTKKTVVLGLGNPIMSDEGIGVVLVRRLSELSQDGPSIDFVDAGTGGFSLLYHLEDVDRAIILDCALMGTEPGTLKRFTCQEVQSVKQLSHFSLHEGDILTLLDKAKQLGQCPEEVVIYGIEPEVIDFGLELTATLANRVDDYLETIQDELAVRQ